MAWLKTSSNAISETMGPRSAVRTMTIRAGMSMASKSATNNAAVSLQSPMP